MSSFTFVMMFRFFKAFRANPRLSIATNTMAQATVDIVHFGVVFLVIFMSFGLIGHISFGHLHSGYRNTYWFMVTCWNTLMGDFDVGAMISIDTLMGPIWFLFFMVLVLLILLNMLLAIVMDTYSDVKGQQGSDVLTIWDQVFTTYTQLNEQRGFVPTWPIICEFEDDDDPAHPEESVTAESLRAAFSGRDGINMSYMQAKYTVTHAAEWVKRDFEKEQEPVNLFNVLQVIAKMQGMVKRMQEKTWEKLDYVSDMHATTKSMVAHIPGVPTMDIVRGSGARRSVFATADQSRLSIGTTAPGMNQSQQLGASPMGAPVGAPGAPPQPGALPPGAQQIGAPQLGAPQIGAPQLGAPQMGAQQMGAQQMGAQQVRAPQPGSPQMGSPQMGVTQISGSTQDTTASSPIRGSVRKVELDSSYEEDEAGLAGVRQEIKLWSGTGSQLGRDVLAKMETVERTVRIIEKGVDQQKETLARGGQNESTDRLQREVDELTETITAMSASQEELLRLAKDIQSRTSNLDKRTRERDINLGDLMLAAQSGSQPRPQSRGEDEEKNE
jgi:hypothetical protein